MNVSVFEAGMLICFGLSWPINIYKSATSKTAKGKSLLFSLIIFVGYISGVLHKYFYSPDFVMYLYVLNLLMVSVDIVLTLRNRKLDKQRGADAVQTGD